MAFIDAILSLKARGWWSNRLVARELGVDRDTVSRQLRSNTAEAPTEAQPDPNAAKAPHQGGAAGRGKRQDMPRGAIHPQSFLKSQFSLHSAANEDFRTTDLCLVPRMDYYSQGTQCLPFLMNSAVGVTRQLIPPAEFLRRQSCINSGPYVAGVANVAALSIPPLF
jgi:hypothetical protein